MDEIYKEYLEALNPHKIQNFQNIIKSHPKRLFEKTIGNTAILKKDEKIYIPPVQYRISFIKTVIKELEKLDQKEDEESETDLSLWYNALEYCSSESSLTEDFYRIYTNNKFPNDPIKIFENENQFLMDGTTGLLTWEASKEMVKWFDNMSPSFLNEIKTDWMIEIGCGVGFLPIFTVKYIFPEIKCYLATDGSHIAVEGLKKNVEFNETNDLIECHVIDWEEDKLKLRDLVLNKTKQFGRGTLLGSDILFDTCYIGPLINIFEDFFLLQNSCQLKGKIILSFTVRNEDTISEFMKALEDKNWQIKKISITQRNFILIIDN